MKKYMVGMAFLLTACASQQPADPPTAEQLPVDGGHAVLAVLALIPGANFFILPVEQALTGTTGLTEALKGTCQGLGGTFNPANGDCAL